MWYALDKYQWSVDLLFWWVFGDAYMGSNWVKLVLGGCCMQLCSLFFLDWDCIMLYVWCFGVNVDVTFIPWIFLLPICMDYGP